MERDIELNYVQSADDLDAQIVGGDLKLGPSLANRIIVSLFTWAAPNDGDNVPDGITPGGYWGDNVASRDTETPGTFGSRIWELNGKITDETTELVETYAQESLEWITQEENIDEFTVTAVRNGVSQIDLTVTLTMANGETQRLVYADILNWGK